MSDSSQGDGWWLASDGKWYPPASRPAPPLPPPPSQRRITPDEAHRLDLERREQNAWWRDRKKVGIAAVILVVVAVIATAAQEDGSSVNNSPNRGVVATCARLASAAERAGRGGFVDNDEWQEEVDSITDDARASGDAGLLGRTSRMSQAFRSGNESAFNDAIVDAGTYCAANT